MAVTTLTFSRTDGYTTSEAVTCDGADFRLRVDKEDGAVVEVQTSVDGTEDYVTKGYFGLRQTEDEVTIAGAVAGLKLRLRSASVFTAVKMLTA